MSVYLTRRDPSRNLSRFYRMLIVPDLFGHWVLLREWGRIGAGGQVKAEVFANAGEALIALQKMTREKKKRGYAQIDSSSNL